MIGLHLYLCELRIVILINIQIIASLDDGKPFLVAPEFF